MVEDQQQMVARSMSPRMVLQKNTHFWRVLRRVHVGRIAVIWADK
jgi:hypothetical protein